MTAAPIDNLDIIHPYFLNDWNNFGLFFDDVEIVKNKDGLVTMNGLIKGDFSKVIGFINEYHNQLKNISLSLQKHKNLIRQNRTSIIKLLK